jgi:hypothetical protein
MNSTSNIYPNIAKLWILRNKSGKKALIVVRIEISNILRASI